MDGHFTGYASLFGTPDLGRDVVVPGAFRASLARRGAAGVRMLCSHLNSEKRNNRRVMVFSDTAIPTFLSTRSPSDRLARIEREQRERLEGVRFDVSDAPHGEAPSAAVVATREMTAAEWAAKHCPEVEPTRH